MGQKKRIRQKVRNMDREEAKRVLEFDLDHIYNDESKAALRMAIQALGQKPCDNAISREDALMALTGEWSEITDEIIHRFIKRIKALPPVNPQPKTGHWIRYKENCCYNKCSICEYEYCKESNYCPNCGAKMVEPQESEVNE